MRQSLVLDGYALNPGDLSWDNLHRFGRVDAHDRTSEDKILDRAAGAGLLLTNKTPVSAATLRGLPDFRYIGVLATGYNIVGTPAARQGRRYRDEHSNLWNVVSCPVRILRCWAG